MLCGLANANFAIDEKDPLTSLNFFFHNKTHKKDIEGLIADLDADSFAKRNTAFEKLTNLPALPNFVRQIAKEEPRPEIRSRLEDLADRFTVEYESHQLHHLLDQIHTAKQKGALAPLVSIVKADKWQINPRSLHDAAQATVLPDDLPLIAKCLSSKSEDVRRLIAAALEGLPLKEALNSLKKLLNDPSEQVKLSAALSLARHKHKACLPAFARLLGSSDFFTRQQSWSALRALSGQKFDYNPSEESSKRNAAASKWKRWSSSSKASINGVLPENLLVSLFNGQDLSGWDIYEDGKLVGDQQTSWKVVDRQLKCLGINRGDIRTQQRFENYVLTLDYNIDKKGGDGGIGIMFTKKNEAAGQAAGRNEGKYLEVQLLPGKSGDLYSIGNFKARAQGKAITFSSPRTAQVADPPAKWHQLKLTVEKGSVKVHLNGVLVNEATDGSQGLGRVIIRNEGSQFSYKNILLSRIKK